MLLHGWWLNQVCSSEVPVKKDPALFKGGVNSDKEEG